MAQGKVKHASSGNPGHQKRKQGICIVIIFLAPKKANISTFSKKTNQRISKDINKNIEEVMRERAGQFIFKHARQVLAGKSKTIKKE